MTADGQVVIVGAGVSGLTTGVELLDAGLRVRIVASEIPGRTSLAAGAMWGPYLVEPWDRVREWSLTSLDVFRELSAVVGAGVRMTSGVEAARHPVETPPWAALLPDFHDCEPKDLPRGFVGGHRFTVPLIDMPIYLDYLSRRFLGLGGEIEAGTVESLDELADADVIVNCAGLGAGQLAGDPDVRPIRGQHVVVENPGITEFFSEDTGLSPNLVCFYPHGDTITLGGTAIDGEPELTDDLAVAKAIVQRCAEIDPRIGDARVLEHRVGARPTRGEVRVEVNRRSDGVPVVHNYGHGGSGVTLSWGCAQEVARLITGTHDS
ncbi:FAD-dependent oxidoreductase [Streptomyces sp. TRM66268-LWL]|uniref:D-amino-acid oxidase n=1 Tax=Streptomyces polyasparticus TaxID=2767826 RepID=A0ABR7SQN9_9ACTN|nr:FAD-dependent oxidoreductase [Streptomyces polyasparticus]MBC9717816.1 FAD-dependent oxidoreductase [Streptomyces polyasparticus]